MISGVRGKTPERLTACSKLNRKCTCTTISPLITPDRASQDHRRFHPMKNPVGQRLRRIWVNSPIARKGAG
jgi:hypothetical protein